MSALPIPFGWYQAGWSDELASSGVHGFRLGERELVAFRGASGEVSILDSTCPHLGADLSGGCVRGERLQCPFHAWQFAGDGRCVAVPHAKKIPPRARLRAWPTCEVDGRIMVWYAPEGVAPSYELLGVPELREGRWSRAQTRSWRVSVDVQDQAENIFDAAHFQPVHGTHEPVELQAEYEGPRARSWYTNTVRFVGKEFSVEGEFRMIGPGYTVSAVQSLRRIILVVATQPLAPGDTLIHLSVWVRRTLNLPLDLLLQRLLVDRVVADFEKDVAIWERKVHLERPLLSSADGPIMAYRRWFQQFYASAGTMPPQ